MIPDLSLSLLTSALDLVSQRQSVISNNIANANSIDFTSKQLNFEQQLMQAESFSDIQQIKPELVDTLEPVKIDHEMAMSIQNSTQYRALIKGINQKFAIMQIALRGQS